MNVPASWLEGDNFVIIISFHNAVMKYAKFSFIRDTVQIMTNMREDKKVIFIDDINLSNIKIDNNTIFSLYHLPHSRHYFEFAIIKTKGLIIQIIPVGSTLSQSIDCVKSIDIEIYKALIKFLVIFDSFKK